MSGSPFDGYEEEAKQSSPFDGYDSAPPAPAPQQERSWLMDVNPYASAGDAESAKVGGANLGAYFSDWLHRTQEENSAQFSDPGILNTAKYLMTATEPAIAPIMAPGLLLWNTLQEAVKSGDVAPGTLGSRLSGAAGASLPWGLGQDLIQNAQEAQPEGWRPGYDEERQAVMMAEAGLPDLVAAGGANLLGQAGVLLSMGGLHGLARPKVGIPKAAMADFAREGQRFAQGAKPVFQPEPPPQNIATSAEVADATKGLGYERPAVVETTPAAVVQDLGRAVAEGTMDINAFPEYMRPAVLEQARKYSQGEFRIQDQAQTGMELLPPEPAGFPKYEKPMSSGRERVVSEADRATLGMGPTSARAIYGEGMKQVEPVVAAVKRGDMRLEDVPVEFRREVGERLVSHYAEAVEQGAMGIAEVPVEVRRLVERNLFERSSQQAPDMAGAPRLPGGYEKPTATRLPRGPEPPPAPPPAEPPQPTYPRTGPKGDYAKPASEGRTAADPAELDYIRDNYPDPTKPTRMNSGLTPIDISESTRALIKATKLDETTAGKYLTRGLEHFEAGYTRFMDWSQAMVKEFGAGIKKHLEAIWAQAKKAHEWYKKQPFSSERGFINPFAPKREAPTGLLGNITNKETPALKKASEAVDAVKGATSRDIREKLTDIHAQSVGMYEDMTGLKPEKYDPTTVGTDYRALVRIAGNEERAADWASNGYRKAFSDERAGQGLNPLWDKLTKGKTEDQAFAAKQDLNDLIVAQRTLEYARKFAEDQHPNAPSMVDLRDATNAHYAAKGKLKIAVSKGDAAGAAKAQREVEATGKSLSRELKARTAYGMDRDVVRAKDIGNELTGIGKGTGLSDTEVARAMLDKAQSEWAPQRMADAQEAASLYRKAGHEILDMYAERGILSPQAVEKMKRGNEFYADLHRVDAEFTGAIKSAKGGGGVINDPVSNLAQQYHMAAKKASKQDATNAFMAGGLNPDWTVTQRAQDLGMRMLSEGEKSDHAITMLSDGVEVRYEVPKAVYEDLKGLNEINVNIPYITAILRTVASVKRGAVTAAPAFKIMNVSRDAFERSVLGEMSDAPWQMADLKNYKSDLQRLKESGGSQGGYGERTQGDFNKLVRRRIQEMTGDKRQIIVRGAQEFLEFSEQSNRTAAYRNAFKEAKKRGASDYDASVYAALKARDLLDFNRGGSVVKWMNQYVPFANAGVQGVSKAIRTIKANPGRTGAKFAAVILVPKLAEYVAIQQSGRYDEWRQMPSYQRDYFLTIPIGDDKWLRIPMGYTFAPFASGVTRMIDAMRGKTGAFDKYGGSLAKTAVPLDPTAVQGPISAMWEIRANYNSWTGERIVPSYEENRALSERKGAANASDMSKGISWALAQTGLESLEVDPRYIDHFINSQFGHFGRMATDAGKGKPVVTGRALTGLTTETPGYNAVDVQWVLDYAERHGLGQSRDMKDFKEVMHDAVAEKDPAKAERKKRDLMRYAAEIRKVYGGAKR